MSVNAMFLRFIFISIYFCCFVVSAYEKNENPSPLPLNTVLDEKGQPIALADLKKPAMEYRFESQVPLDSSKKKSKSSSKKRFKDLSRKEMLKSRANVANDPSCHWLNQRMNQLEKKLMGTMDGMDMRFGYHKKELNARKKEWLCLKCGVEGPNVHDYAKCQFKR